MFGHGGAVGVQMDEMFNSISDGKVQTRLSQQQKTMLHQCMNQYPNLNEGKFTPEFSHHSAQKIWSKIANRLNSVPGARKTWIQWRRTWQDIKINSKKTQFPTFPEYHGVSYEVSEKIDFDEMHVSDDAKDNDETEEIHLKRTRAKNMSKPQKKLLYNLVNSNEKLRNSKNEGSTVSCLAKRREWKKIALKLNSVIGPQKTWSQWKKCWHDIQKYYVRSDLIEKMLNSSVDDRNIPESIETRHCINRVGNDDDVPSVSQLNYAIKSIVERPELATKSFSTSLSDKLNALGPCIQTPQEWSTVWTGYKSKVMKFADRNGIANLNNLQRLTYEHIEQERIKGVRKPCESILTEKQLQILNRTAEQECNIIGSLVAVKLRSMQKEQKLIAEKLISEILFQGQMEMFQYSDKAVNIPGYT